MYITNTIQTFDQDLINQAIQHAKEVFPEESCGAVIDNKYERFANRADDKINSFRIEDKHFEDMYRNERIQCVIHSHNDDAVSQATKEDQAAQQELDIPFGIIDMRGGAPIHVVFWGDSLPIEPLLGRPFFYGVWDCFGIVRDYIRKNTEWTPPNTPHKWEFWLENISLFEDAINKKSLPYDYIDIKDSKLGDVYLYSIHHHKYINHCGIYLGNGQVMHHLPKYKSCKYPISWQRQYLRSVLRHNPEWYKE